MQFQYFSIYFYPSHKLNSALQHFNSLNWKLNATQFAYFPTFSPHSLCYRSRAPTMTALQLTGIMPLRLSTISKTSSGMHDSISKENPKNSLFQTIWSRYRGSYQEPPRTQVPGSTRGPTHLWTTCQGVQRLPGKIPGWLCGQGGDCLLERVWGEDYDNFQVILYMVISFLILSLLISIFQIIPLIQYN